MLFDVRICKIKTKYKTEKRINIIIILNKNLFF